MPGDGGENMIFSRRKNPPPLNKLNKPLEWTAIASADLLATHGPLLHDITRLVGVPAAHYAQLYAPAIAAFAGWVQQLPASEVHHHAHAGGLLTHTLEVVVLALRLRQAHLLPPGGDAETLAHRADAWTYGVFCGALLHDVAKIVCDQAVWIVAETGARRWQPLLGPMPVGARYRLQFNPRRRYGTHTKLPLLLSRQILPAAGLDWLTTDPELFDAWVSWLTGHNDDAGVLGDIVQRADGLSVAQSLGTDTPRIAQQTIPLHEKLLTGLRHLLAAGGLPVNRPGAAGWVKDGHVWLVSKRVIDALREHLTAEGHTGIPTRNDRIFDVLQEHRLIVPTPGNQAIWSATVSQEDFSYRLTLLRFPVAILYPNAATRPADFSGSVMVPEAPADESDQGKDHPAQPAASPVGDAPSVTPAASGEAATPNAADGPQTTKPAPTSDNLGRQFLGWLKAQADAGQLLYNLPEARIHRVAEGLFLVSPQIFRDFATAALQRADRWQEAQKKFTKLRLHKQHPNKTNIWECRAEKPGGNHDGTARYLKGMLLPDVSLVFAGEPPKINPALNLVQYVGKPL